MQDPELALPTFYILNRECPLEHARYIKDVLSITPIVGAIISDQRDYPLAMMFTDSVLHAETPERAQELAIELVEQDGVLPLVIGQADMLDAIYPDGRKESVAVRQYE